MGKLTFKACLGSGSGLLAIKRPYAMQLCACALAPMQYVCVLGTLLGGTKLCLTCVTGWEYAKHVASK